MPILLKGFGEKFSMAEHTDDIVLVDTADKPARNQARARDMGEEPDPPTEDEEYEEVEEKQTEQTPPIPRLYYAFCSPLCIFRPVAPKNEKYIFAFTHFSY
ncbi:unnamed protein product, partial [Cuscuta europaea]